MTSIVVRYPSLVLQDAQVIETEHGKQIRLWGIVPLFPEEYEFKNKNGFASLDRLLTENGITELLDPERKNVALPQ